MVRPVANASRDGVPVSAATTVVTVSAFVLLLYDQPRCFWLETLRAGRRDEQTGNRCIAAS